jgi:hypothetical protein
VDLSAILALIVPLLLLQVVLWVLAIYDLTRPDRRVRGDNKLIWALVIIFGQLLGALVYFLFGREDV